MEDAKKNNQITLTKMSDDEKLAYAKSATVNEGCTIM